jgi:hypothetical protein
MLSWAAIGAGLNSVIIRPVVSPISASAINVKIAAPMIERRLMRAC